MTFCSFTTTTHGKWILAGEHAVLRGHEAVVFPVKSKILQLNYEPNSSPLHAEITGVNADDTAQLFWQVLKQGQYFLGRPFKNLTGHFKLYSDIPLGVGMGGSAALCVALARWFDAQQQLTNETIFSFAMRLEHLFHGKSSGLDIAGVAAQGGIYFKQGQFSELNHRWTPTWFLSYCDQIGITARCIVQVAKLWQQDTTLASSIDLKMAQATKLCQTSLSADNTLAFEQLKTAINLGAECFYQWDLVSRKLKAHMNQLKQLGAAAVKPTGSGYGGYVISLWETPPPQLPFELIAV